MTRTRIFNTPSYALTSWGNGTAYAMVRKATNESIYVQGEDASTFWEELSGLEIHRPDWTVEQVLEELFSIYETVATKEFA